MQTKDHLTLGRDLLEKSGSKELYRHRRSFLLGCVVPDYNILTYMRGALKSRGIKGHNAENTEKLIASRIKCFQTFGLRSSFDYFQLGCILHYTADAFTLPHNAFSGMDLAKHLAYEKQLHRMFSDLLDHSPNFGSAFSILHPLKYDYLIQISRLRIVFLLPISHLIFLPLSAFILDYHQM